MASVGWVFEKEEVPWLLKLLGKEESLDEGRGFVTFGVEKVELQWGSP